MARRRVPRPATEPADWTISTYILKVLLVVDAEQNIFEDTGEDQKQIEQAAEAV